MEQRPDTLLICCGAVAKEIVALVRENGWDHMKVQCLPAHYHNTPEKIPERLRSTIRTGLARFERVLVLYGDCGTGGLLDQVVEEEGVEHIGGAHCYEIFTGSVEFADLIKAEPGCFFLTDFLARRFETLVFKGLGLDRYPKLRSTYFGNYKKLVYLAQSDAPELLAKAQAAADSIGLELEVRHTGYGEFRSFLLAREERAASPAGGRAACPRPPEANLSRRPREHDPVQRSCRVLP